MTGCARTEGERRFEQYLKAIGYPFEYERGFPGKSKRPDYTVTRNGTFLFDVKDADRKIPHGRGITQYDPHEGIIERINSGRKKFKEFKEFPCCIVLQNNGNVFVDIETPAAVLGAMYGKVGFTVPVYVGGGIPSSPAPPIRPAFLSGARMQPERNTTISALISLRRVAVGKLRLRRIRQENPQLSFDDALTVASERFGCDYDFGELQQGVIVWENAYARKPLPRDMFNGPFDERWGLDGADIACVFYGPQLAQLS